MKSIYELSIDEQSEAADESVGRIISSIWKKLPWHVRLRVWISIQLNDALDVILNMLSDLGVIP